MNPRCSFASRFIFVAAALGLGGAPLAAADTPPVSSELFREMHWRNVGPFRGGRTRAATGVRNQPNVFYMAQVNGGVWKTDDYGRTWNPIFDAQSTQSIGALAVAPSDANILYAGSGEGLQRPDLSVGNGVYRSGDAGRTWTQLGLRDGQQIPALAVDPRDPNRLFAAVLGHPYGANEERGVFLSTDGGANWTKSLYVDANTGASDVCFDPANPEIVYASLWEGRHAPWEFGNQYNGSHGGLFKSTDGGKTWRQLTNGLPADLVQINLTVAPSDSRRLYANVATETRVEIFRSDDAGESWARATSDVRPVPRIGGGDLSVPRVDPRNPDIVYSVSVVLWRSTDGAKTWTALKGAPGGDDYQNLWINPDNSDVMLVASDQGAVVTVNNGRTWSSWYNQPTAQLYHVTADNAFPYRIYSGQQESGSVGIASRGNDGYIGFREWHPTGVIEYGYAAPDPLDLNIVYGAGRGEVSRFHWDTGQVEMITPSPLREPQYRADRTSPIMFSPVDPHTLFYATNFLFKTTDGGVSWQTISPDLTRAHPGIPASLGGMADKDPLADKQRGVIYSLAPSPKDGALIWAGTDEGLLWVTRDGGTNWQDVTPPELTPWSKVTQLEASHFDAASAYASVSRFRVDDLQPYIYRTRDGGKSWQLITAGLPAGPIDVVREDPVRRGLLYAGSENSVWVSLDDGDHWQSLQQDLPHASMRDLCVHGNDLIVATHGRGFWILDDVTPLRQLSSALVQKEAALLAPAQAWRVRGNTNTDTPLPPDEPYGENPPDGAVIDFFLREAAPGPVSLEVLDASGKVVRRYASTDAPETTEADIAKLPIPGYWPRRPRTLPTAAGLHRWVWDLHYATPGALRHDYPMTAVAFNTPRSPHGPRALPGTYSVKLTAAGRSYTAPLTVKMDPRVPTNAGGLRELFELQSQLAGVMSRTSAAILQARAISEQVEGRTPTAGTPVAEALAAFAKKVKAAQSVPDAVAGSAAPAPTITSANRQASGLYDAADKADAEPSKAMKTAAAKVSGDARSALKDWVALLATEVRGLNAQLKAAGLAEIKIDAKAANDADDSEDDDLG